MAEFNEKHGDIAAIPSFEENARATSLLRVACEQVKCDLSSANDAEIVLYSQELAKNNYLLGKLEISNLPKLPAGSINLEVTFAVDINNI